MQMSPEYRQAEVKSGRWTYKTSIGDTVSFTEFKPFIQGITLTTGELSSGEVFAAAICGFLLVGPFVGWDRLSQGDSRITFLLAKKPRRLLRQQKRRQLQRFRPTARRPQLQPTFQLVGLFLR